jgi:ABC-2 type transport system permease protein
MNKYLAYFLQNSHDFFVHRMRILLIVVTTFVAPLVMMLVLSNLPGKVVSGLTKQEIITYYLTTSILFVFMNSRIDFFVKEAIQQGELAVYLIRPVKFWLVAFVKDMSGRVIRLLFGIPIFILLSVFYSLSPALSMTDLMVLSLMLMLSFSLAFCLSFTVGLLAFWLDEVWGIQNVKEVSVVLLSGVVLPYSFFPEILQRILVFTPFPYLVNWPLRKGFSGSIILEFFIAGIWLLLLISLIVIMWRRGLKKYSALGTY